MAGKRLVWILNMHDLVLGRNPIQKIEQRFRDNERVTIGGRCAIFEVERIQTNPAVFVVCHEDSGNVWTVAEGTDGELEVVSGPLNLPRGEGLSAKAVLRAAKQKR